MDELVAFDIADAPSNTGEAAFSVRNAGNGCELLKLVAAVDDGSSALIAIDTDGDGQFDAARDDTYDPANAPSICPGAGSAVSWV